MSLSANLQIKAAITHTNPKDLVTASSPLSFDELVKLVNGTGANQAESVFSDQRTLAASGSENLDLSGSLLDIFGATIAFTKIKAIIVKAAAGNTNNVEVGGAASNGFNSWVGAAGDKIVLKPGGSVCLIAPDAAGYGVTAGTGDLLTIANSGAGTSVTYDIILVGAIT